MNGVEGAHASWVVHVARACCTSFGGDVDAPALPSEDRIAGAHAEARRDVDRGVLVPLLETVVLLDVVQVVLADDHRVLHLGGLDDAGDELTANVDRACDVTSGAGDALCASLPLTWAVRELDDGSLGP
eukprot:6185956-Pleurochrysis_carterae.AAC.4